MMQKDKVILKSNEIRGIPVTCRLEGTLCGKSFCYLVWY